MPQNKGLRDAKLLTCSAWKSITLWYLNIAIDNHHSYINWPFWQTITLPEAPCFFCFEGHGEVPGAATARRPFTSSQLLIHLLRVACGIRVEAKLWTDPDGHILRAEKVKGRPAQPMWLTCWMSNVFWIVMLDMIFRHSYDIYILIKCLSKFHMQRLFRPYRTSHN